MQATYLIYEVENDQFVIAVLIRQPYARMISIFNRFANTSD